MPKSKAQKQHEAQYRLLKSACDVAKQKLVNYAELTKRHYEHINHIVLKHEQYIAMRNEVLYDANTAYKISTTYMNALKAFMEFNND